MNQVAEYLRGFTKNKKIMLSRSSPSSNNNKNNKERKRTSALAYVSIRQHTSAYVSIATGALDTAPPQRKKEEKKQEEKSNLAEGPCPRKRF